MKMLYGKSKEQQKDTESKVSEDNDSTMSEWSAAGIMFP
jgi:hypothetical protein